MSVLIDAGRVHAADFGDLRRRHRLLVGDDGQRLERLDRQPLRGALVEQPPHPFVQLGTRDDLIAAGDFDQLQAARPIVVVLQRLERRLDVFLRLALEQLEEHLRRQRIGRRENQRFDDRLQLVRHRFYSLFVTSFFAPGSPIGCRRVGRPRALVDADRTERCRLEHANQLQANHLEQREKCHDHRAARVVPGEQLLEAAGLGLRQPRQQLLDARLRPAPPRAAAAPSAAAWRARARREMPRAG